MLVGREAELAQLRSRLEGGEAVAVLGEAGVGKTVLLREAAARTGRRVFEGGGLATLAWLPYLPVERALGHKLADGDTAWIAAEIEREVGSGLLVVDDLHWADRETRTLLRHLHRRIGLATAVRRGDAGAPAALSELAALGIDPIEVEPLPEQDATALVSYLSPSLSTATVRKIVSRAGGNPLLLEELTNHGEPTESLRLALAARLRQLGPSARRSMGLLALAGHALSESVVGDGVRELVDAGLILEAEGGLVVRHALLAETLADELDESERCELHETLGRLMTAPGEAARHFAAAGERELARVAATQAAAATPYAGERGRHLALAATCSDGDVAEQLLLGAARALIEAHDFEPVGGLLDQIESDDPLVAAEVHLLRYRMLVVALDFQGAREAWRRGMELASGSGADIETRLRIEAARIAFLLDFDPKAAEIAEAVYAEARRSRRYRGTALYILGSAQVNSRDPRWRRSLEQAAGAASRAGETAVEYSAINNLLMGLVLDGNLSHARDVATRAEARARARRLGGWEQRMAIWQVAISRHLGELTHASERGDVLLNEAAEPLDRLLAVKYITHTLIDLGLLDRARSIIERALVETAQEGSALQDGRLEVHGEALTILARLEFWSGRPRAALAAAVRARPLYASESTSDMRSTAPLVEAWSRFELGLPVDACAFESADGIARGASVEIEAIQQLARGRALAASECFERAADLWRGAMFDGVLRCGWAQGESLRRARRGASAVGVLERVEELARGHGYLGIVASVERSLRLCGARRSAPRGRTRPGLTDRERQVLALVGEGLTNQEIARRLGVGRPTVARLVQSASRKLGAGTRYQAASLAARQ